MAQRVLHSVRVYVMSIVSLAYKRLHWWFSSWRHHHEPIWKESPDLRVSVQLSLARWCTSVLATPALAPEPWALFALNGQAMLSK